MNNSEFEDGDRILIRNYNADESPNPDPNGCEGVVVPYLYNREILIFYHVIITSEGPYKGKLFLLNSKEMVKI